jgi:hypothetical protein
MKTHVVIVLALVAVLVAGCFPVLLHVDKRGRVLIPREDGVFIYDGRKGTTQLLAKVSEGTAAWARWSVNGRMVLVGAINESNRAELLVAKVGGKKAKSYGKFDQMACAFWSPEGKAVTVGELTGQNSCRISMVNLINGDKRVLLDRSLPMHRWLPGGRIVAFRIDARHADTDAYLGNLVVVSAKTGDMSTLAEAICERSSSIDVTSRGLFALLVEWTRFPGFKLTKVDMKKGTKTTLIKQGVISAAWSPDGKHIAVVRYKESDKTLDDDYRRYRRRDPSRVELVVTDADGKNPKVLADGIVTETNSSDDRRPVYPAWLDKKTILYFTRATVYGLRGRSMQLASVKIDGSKQTNLQLGIDEGVAKSLAGGSRRRR